MTADRTTHARRPCQFTKAPVAVCQGQIREDGTMTAISMRKLGVGATVAALAMLMAGCGSSSSGGGTASVSAGSGGSGAGGLNTRSTSIGTVLVDSSGHTVYELAGDTASHQTCTSSCQGFWPPVTSGGSDMVVNGHPVFTFTEDSSAGQTHGQGVKDTWGTWFALDAKGNPISSGSKVSTPTTPASSSSSSSGGGGGYGY
jgi:predicted lipoprotein with Yx(FWY)xxD motif